jgi:hypothetical protein
MKLPVRVRFPNESCETVIQISQKSFKPVNHFEKEIFGWIDQVYVAMNREDWEKANESWSSHRWDISIISKSEDGFLVSAPNGDTQWLTNEEMETYKKNKKQND